MMTLIIIISFLSQLVFLLPIRDRRNPRFGFPWVTFSLVVINTLIHIAVFTVAATSSPEDAWAMIYPYTEVPQLILAGEGLGALSVLTSGFLHGDWAHLLGNMFILWFFGRKVEDATGSLRFALLYLFCLYTSALLSVFARGVFTSPEEAMIPSLGASGAIFGIMTAYMFLYSDQRILTLVLPIPWLFWVPVWLYIGRDLLFNAVIGQLIREGTLVVTVNVFAHLGGAFGGFAFLYLFLHPDVVVRYTSQSE